MAELIYEARLKARKDHECMACIYLTESGILDEGELSFSEFREVVKAKRDGFKIKAGQGYIRQFVKCGGDVATVTVRPEIHDICIKYDLYDV